MVVEITPSFLDWLVPASALFIAILAVVTFVGWLAGFLVSASRKGPVEGFYSVAQVIGNSVIDVTHFSLRRTVAMAMLAIQESIRRRVLIAFAVFVVVMLFAGWYLDVKSPNPSKLYLNFVLSAANYLVLILAVFLSCFSLPTDIKNRTIYTVVTKPVRPLEIVLGRITGFVAVGTALLVTMCLMSYVFVVRGLAHEHLVEADSVQEVASPDTAADDTAVWQGVTTLDAYHRHTFTIYGDGTGETDTVMGHWHPVRRVDEGGDVRYVVGAPQGSLRARIPHYGELRFLDRAGNPARSGINVGHEWNYRSYIEGGGLSAAIYSFHNVTAARYEDGLNLELGLRVFRTHKGNIEKGILGEITVRNPDQGAEFEFSEPIPFVAKEDFTGSERQQIPLPRKLNATDADGNVVEVDLFDDLTDNGRVEVWIRCSQGGQYFGMAQPDVYILGRDAPFALNFLKGYIGIWLQMVIVTTVGVAFSTFLSGAVAMLATLATIMMAMFRTFVVQLATGQLHGGGPVESFIRAISQENLMVDLDIGRIPNLIVQSIDRVFLVIMWGLTMALPDYFDFGTSNYVAMGYNIDFTLLSIHLLKAAAYVVVAAVVGYYFLKTREVAA